jgi:hypothetical protein
MGLHPQQVLLSHALRHKVGPRVLLSPKNGIGHGWREAAAHAMAELPVWLVVAPKALHANWQCYLQAARVNGAMLTTPEYYRAHRGEWAHQGLNILFDLPPMGPVMRDAMRYAAHHAQRVWVRSVAPTAAQHLPGILLHGGQSCSFVLYDALASDVTVTEAYR